MMHGLGTARFFKLIKNVDVKIKLLKKKDLYAYFQIFLIVSI